MATATVAPMSLETLAANVEKLLGELRAAKAKRDAEKQKLAQLETERAGLGTLFARDSVTAADVSRNARDIEVSKVALAGFETLAAEAQKRYDGAGTELRERRTAQAEGAELAELQGIKSEAMALIERLAEKLNSATGDLARYDVLRKRLLDKMARAQTGTVNLFPIPPGVRAADNAIREMDKSTSSKLEPIFKVLRRRQ